MLFFYKREVPGETHPEHPMPKKYVYDFINSEEVIRGVQADENTFVIVMKDGHEESRYVTNPIVKDGKILKDGIKQRQWVMSEIHLDSEDRDRFRKLFEVDLSDYPEETLVHRHD